VAITASWVERNGHQYYNVIWNIHAPEIAGVGYVDIIREWARNGEVNAITSTAIGLKYLSSFDLCNHIDWTNGLTFLYHICSPANETHCRVALWDFSLHRPREQPQEVGNITDCEAWVIFWIAYDGIICTAKVGMKKCSSTRSIFQTSLPETVLHHFHSPNAQLLDFFSQ